MRKLLQILVGLKWLGLVGIIGSITGNKYLSLFWLFFLLGFIEIFMNLQLFFQSMQQLVSYPILMIKHRFKLPTKDTHTSTIQYSLPFEGKWLVANGGVDKTNSHSWGIWPQRYAYDFIICDDAGNTCSGDRTQVQNYYAYGKTILAPADGVVVKVANHHPDSDARGDGSAVCKANDIRGNFVIIKHAEHEYSGIAHLMPGSITVTAGLTVRKGQRIAQCGNSGNTSEPHIHFQMNHGPNFFTSAGLPIQFHNIAVGNDLEIFSGSIEKGQTVQN